jgi:pilus assembly protein CpaF
MPVEAAGMLTAGALDFVVHVAKTGDSPERERRFVSSIREVVGWDGAQVVSSEVFAVAAGGDVAVPVAPISEHRAVILAQHGYDQRTAATR